MLTRGRAIILLLACLGGVLVVSWATVGGPVSLPSPPAGPAPSYVEPSPSSTTSASPSANPTRVPMFDNVGPGTDLSWIRYVLLGLVVAAALWLVVRSRHRLARLYRGTPDTGPAPLRAPAEPSPDAERLAQALAEDRARQLAVVEQGSPRNGIVVAWQRLEEIGADSGLPRHDWETPAEFTTRMLDGLPVDPDAVAELAGLFRVARFSSHPVEESQRHRARAALERLHDGLQRVR
ncbi:MAG: DUF4129 domain-containing protein [Marmoricola sp.]